MGCLAIGLGAADVAMALVTGETWIQVPECINIRFINKPHLGIGGKDIIQYIRGELKRNTVAAERIVEFSGPGCQYLSVDARFAISNMCTVSVSNHLTVGICVINICTGIWRNHRNLRTR